MKTLYIIPVLGALVVSGLNVTTASATSYGHNNHKVNLCHATHSAKNPYVRISVSKHAYGKPGHKNHADKPAVTRKSCDTKPQHQPAKPHKPVKHTPSKCAPYKPHHPTKPQHPPKPHTPTVPTQPPTTPTTPVEQPKPTQPVKVVTSTKPTKTVKPEVVMTDVELPETGGFGASWVVALAASLLAAGATYFVGFLRRQ